MAQLQSSSITGSLVISSSGTDSTTNSLLVTNGAGYEYLKITDGGTVDVRSSLIVNHATNANRSVRIGWGSIYATDTYNELSIGAVYSDNTTPRIYLSGKNSDNTPSDAISIQASNGIGIYSGNAGDHFDPQALLHVSGSGIITGDLDVTGSLHVLGDITVGKISNQSKLVDVGGNFNFDTVAEPSTAERTNFSSSIISSAGNIDNGTHYYHVIYKTADGGETGAYNTPFVEAIITDNTTAGQVQLTGIPTSSDARVTARDIYRTEADDSQYYGKKLATISDNTTTTYTDNLADSSLDQDTLFYRKANSTAGYFYKDNNLFGQAGNVHYTSFGVDALESVTTGQDNVAFGGSALQKTTTGRENTAIGRAAGVDNTTGYGNTYLGYVAGYFNQTGQKNTAVGSFALRQATLSSTSYNTAVGNGALWKLTGSNNHNTALGHAAGQGYQGAYNLHLGSYTGYKSTEGSGGDYNINIGYYTGNDTTGDNNILIGRQLEAPNSGSNNQLNIGNLIYATGLGLGDTLGTGNVGIGTTTPSQKLDVSGSVVFRPSGTSDTISFLSLGSSQSRLVTTSNFGIWPGGSEAMRLLSNGNVGIGITSPAQKLHVAGGDIQLDSGKYIRWDGALGIKKVSNNAMYFYAGTHSTNGGFNFATWNGSTYDEGTVIIRNSGNVGIGTTTPTEKLHVVGKGVFESIDIFKVDATANPRLRVGRYDAETLNFDVDDMVSRIYHKQDETDSSVHKLNLTVDSDSTGGSEINLGFRDNDGSNESTKLAILSTGNVGIGTTSPQATLHVKSPSNFTNTGSLQIDTTSVSSTQVFMDLKGTSGGDQYIFKHYRAGTLQSWMRNDQGRTQFFTQPLSSYLGSTAFTFNTPANVTGNLFSVAHNFNNKFIVSASGDTTIVGDLTVGGTVTAQEFHTEFVSASIIYQSGSTKFGDTSDDIHSFTGSLEVLSGSLVLNNNSTNTLYVNNSSNTSAGIVTTNAYLNISSANYIVLQKSTLSYGGIWTSNNIAHRYREADGTWVDVFKLGGTDNTISIGTIGSVSTGGDIALYTSGSEKVRIKDSGKVGIGTTTPSYNLTVYNDSTTDSFPIVAGSGISVNEFVGIGLSGYVALNGAVKAGMVLDRVGNYGTGDIHFLNNSTEDNNDATLADSKLVIKENGNVGIGTTAPSANLHVSNTGNAQILTQRASGAGVIIQSQESVGVVGTNTNHKLYLNTNGGVRLSINTNGNVGVGTTSPAGILHTYSTSAPVVESPSNAAMIIRRNDNVAYSSLLKYHSGNSEKFVAGLSDSGDFTGSTGEEYFIGTTKTNPLLVLKNDGKLGIGTTSPQLKLHISGSTGADSGIRQSRAGVKIWDQQIDSSGRLIWSHYASEGGSANQLFTLDDSNRVGIGTTSPSEKLQVNGNIAISGSNATLQLREGSAELYKFTAGGTSLDISVNSTNALTIHQSGYIGIGTTSPGRKLTVAGTDNLLFLDSSGNSYLTIDRSATNRRSALVFSTAGDGTSNIPDNIDWALGSADSDEVGDGTGFFIGTNTAATSAKLFISSSGNVGIGTTSPYHRVSSKVSSDNSYAYYAANSAGSNRGGIYIDSSGNTELVLRTGVGQKVSLKADGTSYINGGNVGIGTTSPTRTLEIGTNGGGENILKMHSDVASSYFEIQSIGNVARLLATNNTNLLLQSDGGGGYITFNANGAERMRVAPSGNVGIGTTSPSEKLHVDGGSANVVAQFSSTDNLSSIKISDNDTIVYVGAQDESAFIGIGQNSLQDAKLVVSQSGNVGIGTTSPTSKLHVSGAADVLLIEGSGSTSNTSIFAIDGNNGRLFEVSDDLSDSLFSVNTVAGLPVVEVFADNRVTMGAFNQNDFVISGSKVGIGTSAPVSLLTLEGAVGGDPMLRLKNTGTATSEDAYMAFNRDNTNNQGYTIGLDSGDNSFKISEDGDSITGNNRVTILTGGNVGIGTTSPQRLFDVNGDVRVKRNIYGADGNYIGFFVDGGSAIPIKARSLALTTNFANNAPTNGLYVQGDVGIGVLTPAYKLDVSGSINHAGASYTVPATTSGASGATTVLTGATFDNATLIKASHDGVSTGNYTLELPAASSSTNRTIRIISDSSTDANHNVVIAPTSGDTLDGGTSGFTINRNYEGLMVWSDGTEWFVIQSKNV